MEADPYASLRKDVIDTVVVPDYKAEISSVTKWRSYWKRISNTTESISQIFLAIATVLSFAAGFFDEKYLSFAAGCCSVLCLVLLRFSSYAESESAERNAILTRFLRSLGIAPGPPITTVEDPAPVPPVAVGLQGATFGAEGGARSSKEARAASASVVPLRPASFDAVTHERDSSVVIHEPLPPTPDGTLVAKMRAARAASTTKPKRKADTMRPKKKAQPQEAQPQETSNGEDEVPPPPDEETPVETRAALDDIPKVITAAPRVSFAFGAEGEARSSKEPPGEPEGAPVKETKFPTAV